MAATTVLVTGGAGFLGSYLCDRALQRGFSVICLDNLETSDGSNIRHLQGQPGFSLVQQDLLTPLEAKVDWIFNLADAARPWRTPPDPIQSFKTTLWGFEQMAQLAVRHNAKLLQASSAAVYGEPHEFPQAENHWGHVNPIGMGAGHAEGKRAAETLLMEYHRQLGLQGKLVRIFDTYGPRMHPASGRVVSKFILQALRGEELTIFGDGSQTRSFCFVEDLIDGLWRMMESEGFTGPVNLGHPDEYTILELAELVLELTGSSSKMVFREPPQESPTRRRPELSLAKKRLDWEPKTSLTQGLQTTIEFFQNWIAQHD